MYQYSDLALARMRANGSFTGYFQVYLLTRAPVDIPSNAPPAIANLLNGLGYQALTGSADPLPRVQSSQSAITGPPAAQQVLLGGDIALPDDVPPTYIAAAVFVFDGTLDGVDHPWLFIIDDPFRQIVYPGSTLATVLQSPRVLWKWSLRGTGPTAIVDLTFPGLVRSPGSVDWEPPRTQHVYLFPQKINYVPNPSFEDTGLFGWRASAALTRVMGGVDSANNYYGHVAGAGRLEGIPSLLTSDFVTVSCYVRASGASGTVQMGLCNWDAGWDPSTDVLSEPKAIGPTWTRHSYVATVPDNLAGSGFLLVSTVPFDVDLTMVEQSAELHDYFDGDSQTGIEGDFSWQGVTHKSLSFWYNNRFLVGARLFGTYQDGLIEQVGLVYDWVPAGTSIYTHWDVLSPNDTKQPMADFASHTIP